MNRLKYAALQARNRVSAPLRRARLRELAQQGKTPVCVPFYHRVADRHPNPWTICRDEFRRHVDYFESEFDLIDMAEVQRRVREGDSRRRSVSITFDDGYAENADFALPLLVERSVPCTYFVTTSHATRQEPFPHDQERGIPLPAHTPADLRRWSEAGIEIGLHTRTHVDFSRLYDSDSVRREIVEGKDELEQMIGQAVRYFAFPYGMPWQLTQAAIEQVAEAGLLGFCSAYGGYNLVGGDPFHVRRFHGDPEFARLMNWLSFDVGKVKREPDIRYFLPLTSTCANSAVTS